MGDKMGFRNISDKAVWGATGKGWQEWYAILDEWRMAEKGLALTTKHLCEAYGLAPWWAETIALHYVWARELKTSQEPSVRFGSGDGR